MIAPDDTTYQFLEGRPLVPKGTDWDRALKYWRTLPSDDGVIFDQDIAFDASKITPMVTWGTSPEQVLPIDDRVPNPDDAKSAETREESNSTTADSWRSSTTDPATLRCSGGTETG